MQLDIETITNPVTWNMLLANFPTAHILQTWEWGEFKRATTGWQPERLAFRHDAELVAMASVQTRSIGLLRVMYVPRGPVFDHGNTELQQVLIKALEDIAKGSRAIWLKIDPAVSIGTGVPGEEDEQPDSTGKAFAALLKDRRWRFSKSQVQFRNTLTLDLTLPEDDLLMNMSQNTRRKVRTADKKGVTIREASTGDLDVLYNLYRITGQRDEFLIRPPEYYEKAWRDFMQADLAHALIAEVDGKPIAHVILFHFGQTCWYFYGASSNKERQRMPNYALQWAAIKWAKAQGYRVYDMWGAPDSFTEDDSMWGVYQFKRGFRGTVVRHIGAWDYAPYPLLYAAYTRLWPRVLNWMSRHSSLD